jgi:isopentenyl diphosphate isomerase/L-lactate dehydrogenase-like FMN-dependent dehydrogenase
VAWAYVAGGAGEGRTMRHHRQAFERWRIVPRMLHGVDTTRSHDIGARNTAVITSATGAH